MEPFQLTLQQVTFEEGDLSPTQELDSFSNVVHYDSQFSTAPAISTAALSYAQTYDYKALDKNNSSNHCPRSKAIAQPSRVKTSQVYSQSVCTPCLLNQGTNPHYPNLYQPYSISEAASSSLIHPDSCFVDNPEGFITRKSKIKVSATDIRTLFQVSANTSSAKKKKFNKIKKPVMSSSDSGVAEDSPSPGTEGPQAFESVAEALHLQWSVIGDKKLTPAPPEVVAQIVAEAEKRMKEQSTSASPIQVSGSPVSMPGTASVTDTIQAINYTNPDVMSLNPKLTSSGDSEEISSVPISGNTGGEGDASRDLTSPSTMKELIRIRVPTESITTTKEKSSWFGGKSDNVPTADAGTSSIGSKVNLKSDDKASDLSKDDKEDAQSVSSAASELESFGQSETEKFLKSLPPIKQLDLDSIMPKPSVIRNHSPPVKETSFRPLPSQTSPTVQQITPTDFNLNANSHEILSQFTDSGLSFNAEQQLSPLETVSSVPLTSTPNKPRFVMPQIGPLFNRPLKSLNVNKPNPKSSGESKIHNKQIEEVLKEKAKLEGQLEMLSVEAQATLQERAELQAQVASLKLKLMSSKDVGSEQEMDGLKADLDKLQKVKSLLEQSLGSAQKFLEEKMTEAKILQEELQSSQETSDNLQRKMKEVRDDLRAKEMTIQALKNKIAELYVEVQTVLQAKMESDNEARSAKNDLVSLINTKDWYQKQLQAAQEARSKLQHELTILQAQTSSQGSIIERLKTENTRLRQQLKDTQQRALKEKELLAKHLEKIETEMMDRESAFQEIQRERTLLEDTFDTKLQSVENEKSRIGALLQMTADLESQLEKVQTDLKKKQSQIMTLENEQIDMMKKLTLSQESVIEKDGIIEELNQKLIHVETELKAFQTGMGNRESEVWKLKEEKAVVEISLHAALEEKSTVDKALETLKADMGKVEKSFRLMKQELGNKSTEYDIIRKEKIDIQDELEQIKEKFEQELKGNRIIQKETDDKVMYIDELRTQKVKREEEVKFLEGEVKILKESNCECVKQKENIESELLSVKENLVQTESKLLEVTTDLKRTQEIPLQAAPDENLLQENIELKQAMAQSEKQSQRDLTKQKAKVAKLNADLKSLQDELTERQRLLEGNIELLTSKLREVTADKDKLETELNMAHRKYDLSMLEKQDAMKTELQSMAAELETMKIQKQGLEHQLFEIQRVKELEIIEYQKQLSALDEELSQQRESQTSAEELEETNQRLSLELEKEKGRVAGLMQTNTSLKQHVSELEDALARRESALVDLQGQTQTALREKDNEGEEYIRRIQSLEEGLQQEKDGQRDLRKQIGSKISENKKIKRQLDSHRAEKETLQQDLEDKCQEMERLTSELESSKNVQRAQQGQLNTLDTENKALVHQLERAKRELADNLAREPIIQEQIMSLHWQLDQKSKELEAAQGHMTLADDRQQLEIEDLHKSIQEQKTELESLRKEITDAKQEKLTHQSEMSELRSTLKASLQHHKLTKKLNKGKNQNGEISTRETGTQVESNNIIIPPLPFDLEVVEKLVQESAVKALESKPLDNLQSCLSSLRSEISGLQVQMENHAAMVTTSNESWNSVESQVNELRQIVKTITNTTQQSNTTDSLAAAAVQSASGAIIDV